MATSGSWNYSVAASNIIQAALEDIGVVVAGGTVASADSTLCLQRLNFLAKQWQANTDFAPGLKIWTRQRVILFLANGQQKYLIGPGSSDARTATQWGRTTIDVAEASGQTTLSVAATTDSTTDPGNSYAMTAADIIGVEQDDDTLHWAAISSVSAGDTVTIDTATSAAAAVGNYVYWFTSRAQRLPFVEHAVLQYENLTTTPLEIYRTSANYDLGVADKYADGQPTAILIEPLTTQTRIWLNSQPTRVDRHIILTALYPAEDYDATTDDIAFPQEWYAALEWELAKRVAPSFGRAWTADFESNRKEALMMARSVNPEVSNAYFLANPDY